MNQYNRGQDKIRWGIVGVGDVCEVKSAPALQIVPNSELIAVMRRNATKAKSYAERHGVPKWYDDGDRLINDPEVNAIYIATPPNAHADYTIKAAKAGKPVYVEKPMARTTNECNLMIEACREYKVPLYVAYYRRRLPNFEKVKSLISEGAIGAVRFVRIELLKTAAPDIVANQDRENNWRTDPNVAGGGYFYDLASHQLDYLDYVFGPIKSVFGFAHNQSGLYQASDLVQGLFEFENGLVGSGTWCFSVDKSSEQDKMVIEGALGSIQMSFFGDPKVQLETSAHGIETFEFSMPKHIQLPLIETVVQDLMGQAKCPSTGDSAIRTNWVMQEMTKSFYDA